MPIRPENRDKYPTDWADISLAIRTEAGWLCEACGAAWGEPHPITGSKVVLTVAHLNHNPADCRRENLKSLCARCHLRYDAPLHRWNLRHRRNPGQLDMFGGEPRPTGGDLNQAATPGQNINGVK